MRFFITIAIIFLSMGSCSQRDNSEFVNKIANDFSRNSYFIVLNVKMPKEEVTSIIENDDLYYFFHKTRGYNESKYKKDIIHIIRESKKLNITETYFFNFGFIRINNQSKIYDEIKKGKDFIIGKYFRNHVIIDGLSDEDRGVLIKFLFDWGIASRIDDETGYLVLTR